MISEKNARYVKFSTRKYVSCIHNFHKDFFGEYLSEIKNAKWNKSKWKGLTLMKDPMSLTVYQQLIQELKPKTILEFGTYEGGSALWMKDQIKSLELDCHIHTFDINRNNVKFENDKDLTFHEFDNYQVDNFVSNNLSFFKSLKHPILLIEDSHHNVLELLKAVNEHMLSGDYMVVEDTLDQVKHQTLHDFMSCNEYLVDSFFCDFWGYNNSWNINSIIRKI